MYTHLQRNHKQEVLHSTPGRGVVLLLLLIFLSCFTSVGQTMYPPTGSPTGINTFRGGLVIDSLVFFPKRDTALYYGRNGDVVRHTSNNKLYFFDGTYYRQVGTSDQALTKVDYSDTAAMLQYYLAFGDTAAMLQGYLTVEVDGSITNELQNLGLGTRTNTTQPITITQGTGITLPAATTALAGLFTGTEKTKLNGIAAGAEVNVNTDWNAVSGDAQLLNKPSSLPPSGDAGGDLSGTYPNPQVLDNSHNHTISNVTGLQTALDGKEPAFTILPVTDGGTGVGTITGYIKGNGTTPFTASPTIPYTDITGTPSIPTQYTDEMAQDAVGAMVTTEFTYNDVTPSLGINAISATKVTENTTNRFVTDADKLNWNGKQNQLNGTGFVKANGTTISYDNSTYLTAEVDGSVTNELQNLGNGSATATTRQITITSGTAVTVPAATTSLAGWMIATDKVKLNGIAAGATANQTDAFLLNRSNHTGEQPISTITGLQTQLDSKVKYTDTSSMLANYGSAIDARVKYSDTALMLNNYVPESRTLTINGVTQNLTTNRTWTIPPTDTSNLYAEIQARVKYTDTSAMLSDYGTAINQRVKYTDTSSMLSPYGTAINQRVKYTDTSNMLNPYGTAINQRVKYTDTATMLQYYFRYRDFLGGTDNLNDILETGFYVCSNASVATLALNYPVANTAGILRVYTSTFSGTQVVQEYVTNNGTGLLTNFGFTYQRIRRPLPLNDWTPWKKLATNEDIATVVKYADTAAMLSAYNTAINQRVKYSDTAAMLINYERRSNKITSLATTPPEAYPTASAAKNNDISAVSVTGGGITKTVTLTRPNGNLVTTFNDNNTTYQAGFGLNLSGTSFSVDTTKVIPFDPSGKISVNYLPATLMFYRGTWNPVTNTPTLADGTGQVGWVYMATWPGGIDSTVVNLGSGTLVFYKGDWAIHNGTTWEKSTNSNRVNSVNGYQGVILLTTTDIPEGTNLYYTDLRARQAISAGTGLSYNSTTGVMTNTAPNQVTNLALGTATSTTRPITNTNGTGFTLPSVTTTLAGLMPSADKVKLNGIATGATANQTDAYLLSRPNHTGEQPISTVTGLQTALDGKESLSNKSTSITLGTSNILYPTQNAVKTYVDNSITAIPTPNLQQVTGAGATTTNHMTVASGINSLNLSSIGTSLRVAPTATWSRSYNVGMTDGSNDVGIATFGSYGNTTNIIYGYLSSSLTAPYSGSELKFIDGKVGINLDGSTAPAYRLDVNGSVRLNTVAGTGVGMVVASSEGLLSRQAMPVLTETDPVYTSSIPLQMMYKGQIGDAENLDNYTTTGFYHQTLSAQAASGTNYPVGVAGLLEVMVSGSFIYQTYTTYGPSGIKFFRGRYQDSWSAWKRVADDGFLATNYVPYNGANASVNLNNFNVNLTGGSIIKNLNSTAVFDKVYQGFTGTTNTVGIISLSFPQASTAATMFNVFIRVYGYGNTYLGELNLAFYKQSATVVHAAGRSGLSSSTDDFPTDVIKAGIDATGRVRINLGEATTSWGTYVSFEVSKVEAKFSGYNSDWANGWIHEILTTDPTDYSSLVTLPMERMANRDWTNTNFVASTINAGTPSISANLIDAYNLTTTSQGGVGSSTNLPGSYTSGFLSNIAGGTSSFTTFGSHLDNDAYYFKKNVTGTNGPWYQVASREWVGTQLGSYMTTNTDQLTLSGNKTTTGTWDFRLKNNLFYKDTEGNDRFYLGTAAQLSNGFIFKFSNATQQFQFRDEANDVKAFINTAGQIQSDALASSGTRMLTTNNDGVIGATTMPVLTETDPTVPAHVKSITTTEKANWNTAFGWGDYREFGLGWNGVTGRGIPGNSLDDITTPNGLYAVTPTTIGNPVASSGTVIIERSGANNYVTQKVQLINAGNIERMFLRHYMPNTSTWSTWVEMYHTGNLPNSGLFIGNGATNGSPLTQESGFDFNAIPDRSFTTWTPAASLNAPDGITLGGVLTHSFLGTGSGYATDQFISGNADDQFIFRRRTNSATYSPWFRVASREWVTSQGYTNNTGTVTSVAMSVPTGLTISGSPITSSGTLALGLASGYSIPTTANQANWTTAFGWGNHATAGYELASNKSNSAVLGTSTILYPTQNAVKTYVDNSISSIPQYVGSASIGIIAGFPTVIQRAALTGDVTAAANNNVTVISPGAVTYPKFQNVPGGTLLGRGLLTTGRVGPVTLGDNMSLSGGNVLSSSYRNIADYDLTTTGGVTRTLTVGNGGLFRIANNDVTSYITMGGGGGDPAIHMKGVSGVYVDNLAAVGGTKMVTATGSGQLGTDILPTSGTWNPSVVSSNNVVTPLFELCTFIRVGNVVSISGVVTVGTNTASAANIIFTVPIPTTDGKATGTVTGDELSANGPNNIESSASNIRINFSASSTSGVRRFFTGHYQIL